MIERVVDWEVAAAEARRFKVDVSFVLGPAAHRPRFSLNDKGEPVPFRRRLERTLPTLGVPSDSLSAFFDLSAPGEVQTTASFKWEGERLDRIGLYYEELSRSARGPALIAEVFQRAIGIDPPAPPPGTLPVAVCADLRDGAFVAARDYHLATDRPDDPTPLDDSWATIEPFRERLPFHEAHGTRRFLMARRAVARGGSSGRKLMWMTECHLPSTAAKAWATVDELIAELGFDGPETKALADLRRSWPDGDSLYLYPDLVSLNVDGDGQPEALLVYVSMK